MTSPNPSSVSRRDGAAIFLVSAALLLFQIALTRVLSVVIWYHYAFLVLALVMLGLAVPGVVYAMSGPPRRDLAPLLLAGGAAVPAATILVVKLGARFAAASPLLVIVAVLPATLALGAALCRLLMAAPGVSIARMYGLDLLGAAAGALLAVPLLDAVPTPRLAAACGFLPLVALALRGRRAAGAALALAAALAVALVAGGPFAVTRSKVYDEAASPPLVERWTSLARLTVFGEDSFFLRGHELGFVWGPGRVPPPATPVRQFWIEQDGSAGTPLTAFDGDLSRVGFLLRDVTAAGYGIRPIRRAAVIGAGGGRDILTALAAGVDSVDAVELNPATVDLVSRRFGAFSGDPYHRPGVRAVVADGRSFLACGGATYDLIQLSLTDSWAAGAAGAWALAENDLYTVEAFALYLRRLRPGGLLAVSRWTREAPWLLNLARAALERTGVADPERHLMLLSGDRLATLLVSPRPVDAGDREALFDLALERGFAILYPTPRGRAPVDTLLVRAAETGIETLAGTGARLALPTDDRPYFFLAVPPFGDVRAAAERVRDRTGRTIVTGPAESLRTAMLAVTALSLLLLVAFSAPTLRRAGGMPARRFLAGTLYFAAIGAGFMLLENVFVQRFALYLGHPTRAFTVVVATLLAGMGLGSLAAPRIGAARLDRWGLAVPAALAAFAVALPALVTGTQDAPLAARVAVAGALLAPTGAVLGVFFPLGMLRFGGRLVPWLWAVNGFFGTTASVLALALSVTFGFGAVTWTAAAAYALAWVALAAARRAPG